MSVDPAVVSAGLVARLRAQFTAGTVGDHGLPADVAGKANPPTPYSVVNGQPGSWDAYDGDQADPIGPLVFTVTSVGKTAAEALQRATAVRVAVLEWAPDPAQITLAGPIVSDAPAAAQRVGSLFNAPESFTLPVARTA